MSLSHLDQVHHPHQGRGTADAWFEAAYRDHHQAVTAAARPLCGPDHAADVAHDVFDALWRHPEVFDPERGPLRAFLTSVARHKAIDVLRHETALRAREERTDTSLPPLRIPIDENLVRDEMATRIRVALDSLPPTEREAITTAFYNGFSYRQAAAHLGQPEGTIKSRIRSGLHRLRPHLEDLCDPQGQQPRTRNGPAPVPPAGMGTTEHPTCVQAPPRWFAPPSPAELDLLRLAVGPVLDIGCGPGRHVLALNRAGVRAVGIEVSATFVELARRRGVTVIAGSIFDPIPDIGPWGTCLLLDGNIGIGARPEALLRRARELVGVDGTVLVEAAAPRAPLRRRELRVLVGNSLGPSFSWVDVGIDRLNDLAEKAGLNLKRTWSTEGRWFAQLAT